MSEEKYKPPENAIALEPMDPKDVQQEQEQTQGGRKQKQKQ